MFHRPHGIPKPILPALELHPRRAASWCCLDRVIEMIVYGAADFWVAVAGVPVVVAGLDVVPDVEAVEGGAGGLLMERG